MKKYNFDNETSQLKIDQFSSTIKASAFIFIYLVSFIFVNFIFVSFIRIVLSLFY